MNYLKNLDACVEALEPNLKAKRMANGFLYLILKPETIADRDLYCQLKRFCYALLGEAFSTHINMTDFYDCGFKVDLTILRIMELRQVFSGGCDIPKEQASNDLDFLMSHGWGEAKLEAEFNISRATLYRYRAKSLVSQH
jgi:hypothetical protein